MPGLKGGGRKVPSGEWSLKLAVLNTFGCESTVARSLAASEWSRSLGATSEILHFYCRHIVYGRFGLS